MSSSSTGVAVRETGRSAPSSSTGPEVYAGASWTYRSLTTDGGTITATASPGTLYFSSYAISIRTVWPSGSTAVISPTLTPSTRTSEPA